MMRRIVALVLIISSLLSLVACHGARDFDSFEVQSEFDTSKKYEIVFWAKNEKNIKQTKVYQNAIAEFEKIYPNIRVTMKLYSDYNIIYRDVITNIPTQTTPNVCISYPDHIATYMTGENIVVPLDELVYDEKYGLGGSEIAFDAPTVDEIVPQFLEEGKINGVQYALPFMRSTEALYYNKTYIEALGFDIPEVITWEFIWRVSEAALAKGEDGKYLINGQNQMIPFVYKSTDNMMIQMLKQRGGEYSNEDGDILIFNDTTRSILKELAHYADIGAFSTFAQSSYPADLMNRGQCLFCIDSTAGSVWVGSDGPLSAVGDDAILYEVGVSEIPRISEGSEPVMISQGPSVCLFNKEDPGEVMASWIFVQYLLSNETQIAYSQTEGYVPVTSKAQNSPEYQDYLSRAGELDENGDNYLYYKTKIEASQVILNNLDNTFITPVFNGSTSLRRASGEMIDQVVNATVAKPKRVVDDEFVDSLFEDMVSLYRLDSLRLGEKLDSTTPLPSTSVFLLSSVGVTWVGILVWLGYDRLKKRKKEKSQVHLDKVNK